MNDKETVRIYDSHGFHYDVEFCHTPHMGYSHAFYEGRPIADAELSKLSKPYTDDDREWEDYEEKFDYWKMEINSILKPQCERYFNSKP